MDDTIYAADAIVKYQDKIVLIERLASLPGIAVPGGKRDHPNEWLSDVIRREVEEETGLTFCIEETIATFAAPNRDPRFRVVSTLFVGHGTGVLRPEPGKTRPFLVAPNDVLSFSGKFILDHEDMVRAYLARV